MNYMPSKNETDLIREALTQFNTERVGDDGHTPLNIVEYDAEGNIIGGILGGTYWGGCTWIFYGCIKSIGKRELVQNCFLKRKKKQFKEAVIMFIWIL